MHVSAAWGPQSPQHIQKAADISLHVRCSARTGIFWVRTERNYGLNDRPATWFLGADLDIPLNYQES